MQQITDALSAGISDYLIKPCKRADLARTLTHWENVVHTGAEHKPTFDKINADG
jgi:response regulator of citrate/malate metabolism